jgi:hypothetical protein
MLPDYPIPAIDPMPLPGPVWLLKAYIAVFSAWKGKSNPNAKRLAREIAGMMPSFIAFTITLGVAALLFVQALYGHLLYTSSILIGGPWFSVLVLLMLAYYGYYYFSLKGGQEKSAKTATIVALISSLFFTFIGFIYTNNMTLMLQPERWRAIYAADPSGWNLNLADASVWPRYLHMFFGAFAVAGLVLVVMGLWKRKQDADYSRWLLRQGALWFMIMTGVNFATGFWFLLALPREKMLLFMGGSTLGTASFGIAFMLSLAAIGLLMRAATAPEGAGLFAGLGIGSALLTVLLMVIMRDVLRTAYLAPHFDLASVEVATQTGPMLIFFITFAAGLATLAWMIHKVVTARST